jgi:hypothetical protein
LFDRISLIPVLGVPREDRSLLEAGPRQ